MLTQSIQVLTFSSMLLLAACGGGGDAQSSADTNTNPDPGAVTVLGSRALPGLDVQVESVLLHADQVRVRCNTTGVLQQVVVLRGSDYATGVPLPTQLQSDGTWLVTNVTSGPPSSGYPLLVRAQFSDGNVVESAPGDIVW